MLKLLQNLSKSSGSSSNSLRTQGGCFVGFPFVYVLFQLFIGNAFATQVEVQAFPGKKIRLEVPTGWVQSEDLFGVPLTWLGPMTGEYRPVLTLMEAPQADLDFDPKHLEQAQMDYRNGRTEWLKKMKGKLVRFEKYHFWKKDHLEVHTVGFRYVLNGQEFQEQSHYILCGKSLFHLKSLLPTQQEKEFSTPLERSASNFHCEP